MPEHSHLLIVEPRSGKLSVAMQVLKQQVFTPMPSKKRNWG
ncbi:MAG TPA: hypothetical protein VKW06_11050 [Candidatus Angelobacter sp.]|nr:hypothetical protein [Candidatus Angelobacter sp.]